MSRKVNLFRPRTYLLDAFTGAAGAYSLRQLRAAQTLCCRIRRSSDNAEINIGFDASGNFDSVAALAHCGAGSGFITTWYDQSGNGINALQAAAGNQPRIILNGVVDTLFGRASIKFDGSNDFLNSGNNFNAVSGNLFTTGVGGLQSGANRTFYAKAIQTPNPNRFGLVNGLAADFVAPSGIKSFLVNNSNVLVSSTDTVNSGNRLYSVQINSVTNKLFVNNIETASVAVGVGLSSNAFSFIIGAYLTTAIFPNNGLISELLIWQADKSR
jgi:hypothetical protein